MMRSPNSDTRQSSSPQSSLAANGHDPDHLPANHDPSLQNSMPPRDPIDPRHNEQPNGDRPSVASRKHTSTNNPPDSSQGFWPVLKNPNFLMLWSGQVFSQLADKVYLVLMISLIAIHFQTPGQPISGWVSAIMIAFTIPAILFGSIAGVFVDRWSKKGVLSSTNLLRGGLVLLIPIGLWLFADNATVLGFPTGFWVLLLVTFSVSTLTQFFAPAEQAVIPLIVERKHLLSANSLYTTTMMAAVIIGFAVGEPVLEVVGQWLSQFYPGQDQLAGVELGKEMVVGLGYAIAGGLLLLIRTHEKSFDPDHEHPHVWQDIRDGLLYLNNHPRVRAALIQLVMLFSIFAALAVLAVSLAEVMPAIDSDQFGFLLAAGGVGMAIGAVFVGQFGQRFLRRQLSLVGSIGMALALASLSLFTQNFVVALVIIAFLGTSAAMIGVPMQTTIQAETPEVMRGKVFGLQNNAINIALSLPLVLAGVAERYLGLQTVFLVLAGAVIAAGVLTWYISHRATTKSPT